MTFDLLSGQTLARVTSPFYSSHQFHFLRYTNFSCFLPVCEDQGPLYIFLTKLNKYRWKAKVVSLLTLEVIGNRITTVSQHKVATGCLNDRLLSVALIIDKVLCSSDSPGCGDQRTLHPKSWGQAALTGLSWPQYFSGQLWAHVYAKVSLKGSCLNPSCSRHHS